MQTENDAASALRKRLLADPAVAAHTIESHTDNKLSIGKDVWRLRRGGHLATAVAADATLHTTCGALLDVIALLETELEKPSGADVSELHALIDRPVPTEEPSETDQAVRSLRDAVQGVTIRLYYRGEDSPWNEDPGPSP